MCQVSELKIHRRCKTPTDPIAVFLIWNKGEQLGLCSACWNKVSDSDLEWGDDPRPTLEEILGRRAKEEAEATLTEYNPNKKGKSRYQEVPEENES